jgi:hypothetical protein
MACRKVIMAITSEPDPIMDMNEAFLNRLDIKETVKIRTPKIIA